MTTVDRSLTNQDGRRICTKPRCYNVLLEADGLSSLPIGVIYLYIEALLFWNELHDACTWITRSSQRRSAI